ncbi:unnamed protein product, partial [Rotaria socialis]
MKDEGRGGNGNHHEIFYNIFPKLETDAKVFTIESCSRKSTDFTGTDFANYVHAKFYEITQTEKLNDVLVRSEDSCRIDLLRLGAQFQPNIQSPYFEGKYRGQTKGLREMAKELKVPVHPSIWLAELRNLLSQHPAFQNVS